MVLGLCHAAEQRPDDRGDIAGGDAEAGMAVDDPGVARRDRNVGQERGHQARADRRAVDGRYDRLGTVDHVVDEVPRLLPRLPAVLGIRSEEQPSELQSLMRTSYAVFR